MSKKSMAVTKAEAHIKGLESEIETCRRSIEYNRERAQGYQKQINEVHAILDGMGIGMGLGEYQKLPLSARMFAWVLDMAGGKIERAEQ